MMMMMVVTQRRGTVGGREIETGIAGAGVGAEAEREEAGVGTGVSAKGGNKRVAGDPVGTL